VRSGLGLTGRSEAPATDVVMDFDGVVVVDFDGDGDVDLVATL
jgi:hypothetical protein